MSNSYTVFRPVSGKLVPGIGLREVFAIIAVFIVGLIVSMVLGAVSVEEVHATTVDEHLSMLNDYKTWRNSAWSLEHPLDGGGEWADHSTGAVRITLADDVMKDYASKAKSIGITAETTDEEIEHMIPSEVTVEVPLMGQFQRVFFFILLPVAAVIGFCIELTQGASLRKEVARAYQSSTSQSLYLSKRGWHNQ